MTLHPVQRLKSNIAVFRQIRTHCPTMYHLNNLACLLHSVCLHLLQRSALHFCRASVSSFQFDLDLKSILSCFCGTLEGTIISLHHLQTAAINASNDDSGPSLQEHFGAFRDRVHTWWNAIDQSLRNGYSFCNDALTLLDSIPNESNENCRALLADMAIRVNLVDSSCKECVRQSNAILGVFDANSPILHALLLKTTVRGGEVHHASVNIPSDMWN
jgi:hypothetical protein